MTLLSIELSSTDNINPVQTPPNGTYVLTKLNSFIEDLQAKIDLIDSERVSQTQLNDISYRITQLGSKNYVTAVDQIRTKINSIRSTSPEPLPLSFVLDLLPLHIKSNLPFESLLDANSKPTLPSDLSHYGGRPRSVPQLAGCKAALDVQAMQAVKIDANAIFNFGSNDFTIEWKTKLYDDNPPRFDVMGTDAWSIKIEGDRLIFGDFEFVLPAPHPLYKTVCNSITRNGELLYYHMDGVLVDTKATLGAAIYGTGPLRIGRLIDTLTYRTGYTYRVLLGGVRIVKNQALYSNNNYVTS